MENFSLPGTYQNNKNTVLRAALYIRVSTAEQAMHGYSIEAQKEFLEEYAKQNGMRIVGVYADEGKSASKSLHKRTELLRMVNDMEAGEIDVILFKDITRWSRNSAHYHRIQDRIDAAGGYWIAVQQPYLETRTPTGRYQVTIMLGGAQLEAEQASERIRFTNASRVPKGGVLYGYRQCPLGYTVALVDGQKRMVIDETERELVNDIFDNFILNQSVIGAVKLIADKYGLKTHDQTIRKMLKNTIYKGVYRGTENYCEPYLTPERWDDIQRMLSKRNYTAHTHTGEYFLSSLVQCPECGQNMHAAGSKYKGKRYRYFRCKNHYMYKTCSFNGQINQDKIEKWLLDNIKPEMEKWKAKVEVENAAPPTHIKQRKRIEQKIKNLRELYIDGDFTKEEYEKRKANFENQLAEIPEYTTVDTSRVEELLNSDWRAMYDALTSPEKKVFWRSIIDKIVPNGKGNYEVFFLE